MALPPTPTARDNEFAAEARSYVETHFAANPGFVRAMTYPVTHAEATRWLSAFLEERLECFGAYQDAISVQQSALFHSLLTPLLNTGLLTPREVIERTLAHAQEHVVPLNSLEGFLRQIIGWREYVRGIYEFHGRRQRSSNAWGHHRHLPAAFWSGKTGIPPVDTIIARVLHTGYAHHIERLMILANFMLLCEFSPNEVYRWFMEMFVDAFDWVMVPNVYGMGLHADGGLMMTKPYISSSSYVVRMSDFKRGPWCAIWDGLFWRFVAKHRTVLGANARMRFVDENLKKLGASRLRAHVAIAEAYLSRLEVS